jgi:hypothetical protein
MSRHGSIFYDAPEALNALFLDENKDELGKMVGWKKENDKGRRERQSFNRSGPADKS